MFQHYVKQGKHTSEEAGGNMDDMKIKRETEVSFLVQLFTETLLNYLHFDEQLNISQS